MIFRADYCRRGREKIPAKRPNKTPATTTRPTRTPRSLPRTTAPRATAPPAVDWRGPSAPPASTSSTAGGSARGGTGRTTRRTAGPWQSCRTGATRISTHNVKYSVSVLEPIIAYRRKKMRKKKEEEEEESELKELKSLDVES